MNINLTNVTEDGILSIVLKIDEDEKQWIQPANRSAVYEALHALVETAEAAEIARIPKDEQAQADTTVSGYSTQYPEPPESSNG